MLFELKKFMFYLIFSLWFYTRQFSLSASYLWYVLQQLMRNIKHDVKSVFDECKESTRKTVEWEINKVLLRIVFKK